VSSFMLDVGEGGMHVALVATHNLEFAERLMKLLRANGFSVRLLHQPASVKLKEEKEGGGGAK
jgi:hypothetical protein